MNKKPVHSFHIPVMGLAYTIDSPIRVAQYGISSVVSIIDDEIAERMRAFYSRKFQYSYSEIPVKSADYRAKRITAYLDLMDSIVRKKFTEFKEDLTENTAALQEFIGILPNASDLRAGLMRVLDKKDDLAGEIRSFMERNLIPGEIDVNIMTKIDKDNFLKNEPLPTVYNDAHAALRGFANSKLSSSVVFSAGMNPRLYSYLEEFDDFYPDSEGNLKKKIILKVSDFRSAMVQGNFLAKKGLWVSEYRIESGLNCGGHAFATEGLLLGPIMEEFKQKKTELVASAHALMTAALAQKGKDSPLQPLRLKITVQGGVGTSEEHEFLLTHYGVDSIGWGSPFLLVPEATSVDPETRALLAEAKAEDFYLSNISPLGVPFNTIRGTTNEVIRNKNISEARYGSSCPKKLLALSKEFSPQGTCTASRKYQDIKLADLESVKGNLSPEQFERSKNKITEKSCLCVGLANSSYVELGIAVKGEQQGVVVCPGPNLSFFSKQVSLSDMVRHIYGNGNILADNARPNIFVNELKLYVDYLKREIGGFSDEITRSQVKKWEGFKSNLLSGISYYEDLFGSTAFFRSGAERIAGQLQEFRLNTSNIIIPQITAE